MNYLRVNLKVCEGCGALWLRTETSTGIYCKHCRGRFAEFAAPRGRHRLLGPRTRRTPHPVAPTRTAAGNTGGAR